MCDSRKEDGVKETVKRYVDGSNEAGASYSTIRKLAATAERMRLGRHCF